MSSQSETIYRAALIQLAESGNEVAKTALACASALNLTKDTRIDVRQVAQFLATSNSLLTDALDYNADEWTSDTDRSIKKAQYNIGQAMVLLTING